MRNLLVLAALAAALGACIEEVPFDTADTMSTDTTSVADNLVDSVTPPPNDVTSSLRVVAHPNPLVFGLAGPGTTTAKQVLVVNEGSAPATVTGVTITSDAADEFELAVMAELPHVLAAGETLALSVSHAELDGNSSSAKVTIELAAGQPDLIVPVEALVPQDPGPAIDLEVSWQADGAVPANATGPDLDLHFIRDLDAALPADLPWFDESRDCFWLNPSPAWFEDGPNPTLQTDAVESGTETLSWERSSPGTFAIGVHGYELPDDSSATAIVKIFIDGVLVHSSAALAVEQNVMWAIGTIVVEDVDEPGDSEPEIRATFEGYGQADESVRLEGIAGPAL